MLLLRLRGGMRVLRRLHRVLRDVLSPMTNDIDDCLTFHGVRIANFARNPGPNLLHSLDSAPLLTSVALRASAQAPHQI